MTNPREDIARLRALTAIEAADEAALDPNTTDARFQSVCAKSKNAVARYAEAMDVDVITAVLRLRG